MRCFTHTHFWPLYLVSKFVYSLPSMSHGHLMAIFLEKWGSPLCSSWIRCLSTVFSIFRKVTKLAQRSLVSSLGNDFYSETLEQVQWWLLQLSLFWDNISPVSIVCKMLYWELFDSLLLFVIAFSAGLWPVLVRWNSFNQYLLNTCCVLGIVSAAVND